MRVLTWNIWNGGEGRVDAIERVLREQDADVVALQEANDREAIETLGSRLDMEVVYGDANSAFAVAWLSRLPVTGSRNHRLPVLEKTLLEVHVDGMQLFATHLSAGRTKAHEPHRVAEAEAIVAIAGDADLLVGDFNAVHPRDESARRLPRKGSNTSHDARSSSSWRRGSSIAIENCIATISAGRISRRTSGLGSTSSSRRGTSRSSVATWSRTSATRRITFRSSRTCGR